MEEYCVRLRGRFFAGALKIIVLRKQNDHQCRSQPNYDVHIFKQSITLVNYTTSDFT